MTYRTSFFCLLIVLLSCIARGEVRSSLYPSDWKPGFADAQGRFLHDFSYAGYHKSEVPLPNVQGRTFDVTKAPYHADPTGQTDATAAIQKALDDAADVGGGVVYLPAGTYRLSFQPDRDYCIRVRSSHTVLRGAGRDKTRLFCDETVSRQKTVVLMRPDRTSWWFNKNGEGTPITQDLLMPTRELPVESTDGYRVGQLIVVRCDFTQGLIDDLGMTGKWKPTQNIRGITLLRRISAIDTARKVVTIDTPTRYPMKQRDALRIYSLADTNIRESGLEGFSVGMKQNRTPGFGDEDYSKEGTGGYEVHMSMAVQLAHCEDAWARDIGTYRPEGNDENVHIHSHGLRLNYCRQVTVTSCDFRHAQYHGGGGNGYLYTFSSNDCLIRDSHAEGGRHNFDWQNMWCVGNVAFRNTSKNGRLPSDFHMYLSTANLIDNMTLDGDFLECRYRPYGGTPHGESGSQNVFWNTRGLAYSDPQKRPWIVFSKQFGIGYVIGTRGPAAKVTSDDDDFVEHVGAGDQLTPESLWIDQLNRRTGSARAGDARLEKP